MQIVPNGSGVQLALGFLDADADTALAVAPSRPQRPVSMAARQFYSSKLLEVFSSYSGEGFEGEMARILGRIYQDFYDPYPYGNRGDGGCDGVANDGEMLFACYGTRSIAKEDDYIQNKMRSDFAKALENWPEMREWHFVTNAKVSADLLRKVLFPLRKEHGPGSERPVVIDIWDRDKMNCLLLNLPPQDLDYLYPGYAEVEDFQLKDFIDVIDDLVGDNRPAANADDICEVSPFKMRYNAIREADALLLNEGMALSGRIEAYFASCGDMELRDAVASRLHASWEELRGLGGDSSDVLHALFERIGGRHYATSGRERRMSTYSVAAFFFQSCDIFENAPEGWPNGGCDPY